MKRTPLYEHHLSLDAKMVEFAGWDMPLQYEGISAEVLAVRKNVAIFDVSHMGEIIVEGDDTTRFLDYLLTNNFSSLKTGQVMYSVMCNQDGGIIDDLLAYKLGENKAMLVVNAANTKKDYEWIVHNSKGFRVTVRDESLSFGLLAVQGPAAESFLSRYLLDLSTLRYYSFASYVLFGKNCLVSRTGYTGEDGFEIYCRWNDTPRIWEELFDLGKDFGLKPAGLGARDVCRLEASYMLYGNDMDDTVTPLEAGLSWTVKFEKEFIGKEKLLKQKAEGVKRRIRGLKLEGKRIARHGMKVFKDGKEIGYITSGTFSPTLEDSIALAMIYGDLKVEEEVQVDVRGNMVSAKIVKLPFYRGTVKSR